MINTLHFSSKSDLSLLDRIKKESQQIGYFNLPNQDTSYIDNYLSQLDELQGLDSITDVVVVGIGGSSLGAKAIYHFLKPLNNLSRQLHFMDSTDPVAIHNACLNLNLESCHFLIISKSGTTIETIAIYKYLIEALKNHSNNQHPFTFITDQGSKLEAHAKTKSALVVNIQDNVGGRFSALSTAGLIPLALAGINIKLLLSGAEKVQKSFFEAGYMQETLLKKAQFYAENSLTYGINSIFSYSESLKYFNHWYVQLWGESLGKKQKNSSFNVGLTPIGLIGPKDQHSFLQLLTEGKRDKTVTFIKLESFDNLLKIPEDTLEGLEALDIINGTHFSSLINMQADSIIESIQDSQNIPLDEITLKKQDAFSIGQLIYYYQLLTSMVGDLLNINTYNQPGVEAGKNILINKLKSIK
ncbi:MAG: glucose-6-phosphate isomerase [Gammaproteobacteria bacterium]